MTGRCKWCGTTSADADLQAVGVIMGASGSGWTIHGCGPCRGRKQVVLLADQIGTDGLPQRADGTHVH